MKTSSRSAGFTLLEALIALAILATGLLAIARFQSGLVTTSASNKARAEAIALAQQKTDEIRAYKDEPDLVSKLNNVTYDSTHTFNVNVADATVADPGNPISGINADFTRSWEITRTPTTAQVNVTVTWSDAGSGVDASGNAFTESVMLSTDIVYQDPALAGEQSLDEPEPIIPNTTGRSRLGEGYYDPTTQLPSMDTRDNDDGTVTYENLGTGEVELIDSTTGDVLLTLEEACNVTDGGQTVCTDFVKINGLIWVDDGSLPGTPDLDTIYVLASDNAVCTHKTDLAIDTGNFRYYPYRCYLGGGWSGNLGIVQTGANNTIGDVCMGDPASDTNEEIIAARRVYRGMLSRDLYTLTTEPPATPQSVLGRDLKTDDVLPSPTGGDGIEEFDAIGIADALEMPNFANTNINAEYNAGNYDPFGNLYLPGHNFMITNLGATPEDADCIPPLTDAEVVIPLYDADPTDGSANFVKNIGGFLNTKDEFVCLNQSYSYDTADENGDPITALQIYFDAIDTRIEDGYVDIDKDQIKYTSTSVDASGNTVYTISATQAADASGNADVTNNIVNTSSAHVLIINECPYNPTANITDREFVFGNLFYSDDSPNPAEGFVVNTSDDAETGLAGACDVYTRPTVGSSTKGSDLGTEATPDAKVFADYVCKVYHDGSGWTGTISVYPANNYGCSAPTSYTYASGTEITSDTGSTDTNLGPGTLDFQCSYIGPTGADLAVTHTVDNSFPLQNSTVTYTTTVTNNGLADVTGLSLTNAVPAGLTYGGTYTTAITIGTAGADTAAGTWDSTTGIWSGIKLLDGDQATLTWTAAVPVATAAGTQITTTVTGLTSDQDDTNLTPDDLDETIIVTDPTKTDILYVKTLTSGNVNPAVGQTVSYDITVTNMGGLALGTDIVVTDNLPDGLTSWTSVVPGFKSINTDASTNWEAATEKWTIPNGLQVGESASLSLTSAVKNPVTLSTITNTLIRPVIATDPSTTGDVVSVSVSPFSGKVADLVTTLSVDDAFPSPTVGTPDTIVFTVTVENDASSADSATNVEVVLTDLSDTTPGEPTGFEVVSSTYPAGTTYNQNTGTWSGFDLAPGESKSMTVTVQVSLSAADTTNINIGYAASTGGGATTDPVPTGDGVVDLLITRGGSNTITIAGGIIYSSDTTIDATGVSIGAVNSSDQPQGLVACGSFSSGDASTATDGSYSCTVTIDPLDNNGVYLQVAFDKTICTYNARISSGTLITTGADELYWLDSTVLGAIDRGTVDLEAYDETGAKANCP